MHVKSVLIHILLFTGYYFIAQESKYISHFHTFLIRFFLSLGGEIQIENSHLVIYIVYIV